MHRRSTVVASLAALALAACSPDAVVTPLKAPSGSKLALGAGLTGNYIVSMRGNGIASGFADRVASLGGTITFAHDKAGFATVSGLTAAAASQIGGIAGVAEIQPDVVVSVSPMVAAQVDAAAAGEPSIESQTKPALAALYPFQWDMRLIGADKAWANGHLGDKGVTVAILDTGLDYDELDLNGLVDLGRSKSFMSSYYLAPKEERMRPSDDFVTKNFYPSRNPIVDYNGHGTNVATQVSSMARIAAGVTSKTTLIGVKVLGSNGSGTLGTVLSGVLWAADHGAQVANMSLGGGFGKSGLGYYVGVINKTFNYARQQGTLIVVAAGNEGSDLQHNGNFNADYCDAPHVICVSSVGPALATDNPDMPAFYTNYGQSVVTVAAPGGNAKLDEKGIPVASDWPWGKDIASWVWSLCARNSIAGWSIVDEKDPSQDKPILSACSKMLLATGEIGTSQASPHVAGLAALLFAENKGASPAQIKHLIETSVVDLDPKYGSLFGRGRISVSKAVGL